MEWKDRSLVTRSALGSNGFVGELYDIRSESLTSQSVFSSSLPKGTIATTNITKTNVDFKFIESSTDRFDLLRVKPELQLSLLSDLIKVSGSGEFLKDEKKFENSVSCSLFVNFLTVSEKLFASFEEIIDHVDLDALNDPFYTHVIIETTWGASCVLTLESAYSSESEKKNLEGSLEVCVANLKRLLTVEGGANVRKNKNLTFENENLNLSLNSDLMWNNEIPLTLENFEKFLAEAPKELKKLNAGKGKPLSYVLLPLTSFRNVQRIRTKELAEIVSKTVDESLLFSMIYYFDEISLVKRKLNNLLVELNEYKKYLDGECLKRARDKIEILKARESELKLVIKENLVSFKSGTKTLRNFIQDVEKLKSQIKLNDYEDFLDSYHSVRGKITTVRSYLSSGAIYLGKGDQLLDLCLQSPNTEFVVLVISSELEKKNPQIYLNTCHYFTILANEGESNTKYVVLDLDLVDFSDLKEFFLNVNLATAKCVRLKGSKVISPDLFGEYLIEIESNFVRPKNQLESFTRKPINRTVLSIMCPGFSLGTCGQDVVSWSCQKCKNEIEYGFDQQFYCSCGKGRETEYEFRCSNRKHGASFVSARPDFLKRELSNLNPLKEMNVLILGQSGVGKSTWINSIINYLTYETLEEAKLGGALCEIPIRHIIYDPNTLEKHEVNIGKKSLNEVMETGSSATQCCHTYHFVWEDRLVRLIDTPGIGDTEGIEKDKENMKNIIDHVSYLKELHGVCILVKASDNKINAIFKYCLSELLVHLHKTVAQNIVFCFTNARSSLYRPGQAALLLEKHFSTSNATRKIVLNGNNMFFLDNEAFLFLCTLHNPNIRFDDDLIQSFVRSWDVSLKETHRLFTTIKNFRPHYLEETLSLVTCRQRILCLTKPIAEISKTIHLNLSAIQRKKADILAKDIEIENLSKKLKHTEIHLVPVPLKYPRTVCTSPSCVVYHKYSSIDVSDTEFSTHCHVECYLKGVEPKTTSNPELRNCHAMNKMGNCNFCGCSWQKHMHLTYSQKREEREAVDKTVESNLKQEEVKKSQIEEFIANLEKTTEEYEKEINFIIETSVKFGMFLKQNAIHVYNDGLRDYLKYLIQQEETKPYRSKEEEKLLSDMRETLERYEAEVNILQEVMNKQGKETAVLTPQEVFDLEQRLYELKLCGKDIRINVEMNRQTARKTVAYEETPLDIDAAKGGDRSSKKKKNWPRINFRF